MRFRSRLKLAANGDYARTRPVFEKAAGGNLRELRPKEGFGMRVRIKTP
jgi:hypothetical protein